MHAYTHAYVQGCVHIYIHTRLTPVRVNPPDDPATKPCGNPHLALKPPGSPDAEGGATGYTCPAVNPITLVVCIYISG